MRTRLVMFALVACLGSALQFGFYDCSGLPALSFGAGALTVFAGLLSIDRVHAVVRSARPAAQRVAIAIAVGVVGAAVVVGLGAFTVLTHMCG